MIAIRPAVETDVATILGFVRGLAAFEHEPDAVQATEAMLTDALFGGRLVEEPRQSDTLAGAAAEAAIAEVAGVAVGFALFFHNFSTWTGRRGLYLEDLYVTPEARGQGVGGALLRHLAGVAVARGCARFEWSVLDRKESADRGRPARCRAGGGHLAWCLDFARHERREARPDRVRRKKRVETRAGRKR